MSSSSDSESSESSGNEYLAKPRELDLQSSFFQTQTAKSSSSGVKDNDSSDSNDDSPLEENVDSAALLAEVMRNLENAKKAEESQKANLIPAKTSSSPKKESNNVLSDEITSLLLQGESKLGGDRSFEPDDEDAEESEDVKPDNEYTIPKEGVNIVLPGTCVPTFSRRKKGGQDMEEVLRRKMNQQLRSKQVFTHKVGLLCWLAYGFHLNRVINDSEVLSISLSLVPATSYPKGRVDLKYLEQFTKWFRNLIKLEFKDIKEGVGKDALLDRLRERKICNYRELVLLYAAMLRSIGINCRLVVSLCPPALKLRRDQLFQNPKTEIKFETASVASSEPKPSKRGGKAAKTSGRSKKIAEPSNVKIVAENSGESETKAKLEARKRAAEVLAKFDISRVKKPIKQVTTKMDDEKRVSQSSSANPKDATSPPRTRQLRSRVVLQNVKSSTTEAAEKNKNIVDSKTEKSKDKKMPEKRTRVTRASKAAVASTSSKAEDPSDEESKIVQPAKKKKTTEQVTTIAVITSDSDVEFEPKLEVKKIKRIAKRSKPDVTKKITNIDKSKKVRKSVPAAKEESDAAENLESSSSESDSEMGEDFKPKSLKRGISAKNEVKKNNNAATGKRRESIDRRVLSSDDEQTETVDAKGAQNIWVEVFVDAEESWISVCVPESKIHCVSDIYKKAPKPVLYVVAWNSVGSLKDVTRRYCPHWLTVTRKQRTDEKWWEQTLNPWKEKSSVMSRAEDEMLLQRELEQPLPKTVGECKGHPLYALPRHLLKFEALYPPDSVPLGFMKGGEAIYSRHCVHTLCSRETWMKKARVVKPAQEPYKIVKAMPKYDKLSGTMIRDLPLELFGKWQTTQYIPPAAKDGKVPRNEYGSVDLFQESMLPFGTVHINLPALNRVARKLQIDCVPAVVGFNFGSRGAMPVTEGYVVCKEFEETLREAWHEDQIEAGKRAVEKREKRIYGNWRKLIRGLFIRERLAARYGFGRDDSADERDEKPSTSTKSQTTNKDPQKTKENCSRRSKKS